MKFATLQELASMRENCKSLSDFLLCAADAEKLIEAEVVEILTPSKDELCVEVGCDPYDWSIELYVYATLKELTITDEQVNQIAAAIGSKRFWINYCKNRKSNKTYEIFYLQTIDGSPTIERQKLPRKIEKITL